MLVASSTERADGEQEIADLIGRHRSGDPCAFERIFDLYKDRVYNLAVHFCGDRSAAEDITQAVFLKLLERLSQFRGDSGFETWLFAIVRNACFDAGRRKKCRAEEELVQADPVLPPSQLETMERRERIGEVRSAMAGLSPKLRYPLLLRYVAGLSYEEIAEALGASHGTVASRLSRAHLQLARILRGLKERKG